MKLDEVLFLEDNYKEDMNNYYEISKGFKRLEWDWIVITASNINQKESYIKQIEYRKKIGLLPEDLRIDVIEDPEGKRVGSGGATLNVLLFLNNEDKNWFNKKILLIHSGGDSKRIPQYSACGKLFSNIPRKLFNNKCSSIFDEFMVSFSNVPSRIHNGIMILSGDVLLLFNSLQIDVLDYDVASISIKVPVEIGKNHGVILSDDKNCVKKFLHKLTPNELENLGAVDSNGCVDLDTGCIWINSEVAVSMLNLIYKDGKVDKNLYEKYINDKNRLSFYGDLLYPFSSEGTINEYLKLPAEGICDENLVEIRNAIWDSLHNYKFGVLKTSPSKFIHTGTTTELMDLFINAKKEYLYLGWDNNVLTNREINNVSSINSYIYENVNICNNSFIEDSIIEKSSIIHENCLVSNTIFSGELYANTVIHTLPVIVDGQNKYVTRIYGVNDNPKDNKTFLNTSFNDLISNNGLNKTDIFDKEETLWEAKLYSVADSIDESIKYALILQEMSIGKCKTEEINLWKNSHRLSLKDSFNLTNINKMIEHKEKLDNFIRADIMLKDYENNISIEEIMNNVNEYNVFGIIDNIKEKITNNYRDYKIYSLLSYIIERYGDLFEPMLQNKYEDLAYNVIKEYLIKHNKININNDKYNIKQSVSNSFPVRLNFGGGWSDTAPHCIEHGGTVLNAAISLDGKLPITVTIKKNKENKFKFISKDANIECSCSSSKEFGDISNVGDVFILSKTALILFGINDNFLKETGITIITDVDVPKGSGLGTSSILSAGIIKTLGEFLNIQLSNNDICSMTFCVEQMITSGGGWQDQIGGIFPGIKLIETNKGLKQEFEITNVDLKNEVVEELNDKIVLIYAGQRRIAKNLLRNIMNKYIDNDPNTLKILKEIQHLALLMKFELEKGSLYGFNKLLNKHFELSKQLDKGVSNMCIDHLINSSKEFADAFFIAGAGGGGFLIVILKDKTQKELLKEKLSLIYKDIGIKIYDCNFI